MKFILLRLNYVQGLPEQSRLLDRITEWGNVLVGKLPMCLNGDLAQGITLNMYTSYMRCLLWKQRFKVSRASLRLQLILNHRVQLW